MSGVSLTHSNLSYGTNPSVPADGTHTAVVKVCLRDDFDRPVTGRRTELFTDSAGVTIIQPELTNSAGIALGYVSTTTPGLVNIQARVYPLT